MCSKCCVKVCCSCNYDYSPPLGQGAVPASAVWAHRVCVSTFVQGLCLNVCTGFVSQRLYKGLCLNVCTGFVSQRLHRVCVLTFAQGLCLNVCTWFVSQRLYKGLCLNVCTGFVSQLAPHCFLPSVPAAASTVPCGRGSEVQQRKHLPGVPRPGSISGSATLCLWELGLATAPV